MNNSKIKLFLAVFVSILVTFPQIGFAAPVDSMEQLKSTLVGLRQELQSVSDKVPSQTDAGAQSLSASKNIGRISNILRRLEKKVINVVDSVETSAPSVERPKPAESFPEPVSSAPSSEVGGSVVLPGESNVLMATIIPTNKPVVVSVVSPNGGEEWVIGEKRTIKWDLTRKLPTTPINLNNAQWIISLEMQTLCFKAPCINPVIELAELKFSDAHELEWVWDISKEIKPADYKVKVSLIEKTSSICKGNVCIAVARPATKVITEDMSDEKFIIKEAASGIVTVLGPNGGEQYTYGQELRVRADLGGITENGYCNIQLLDEKSGTLYPFGGSTCSSSKDPIYEFGQIITTDNVPQQSAHYKIFFTFQSSSSSLYSEDYSDNEFAILPYSPSDSVVITSPNGGERFVLGDYMQISATLNTRNNGYCSIQIINRETGQMNAFGGSSCSGIKDPNYSFGGILNEGNSVVGKNIVVYLTFLSDDAAEFLEDYSDGVFSIESSVISPKPVEPSPVESGGMLKQIREPLRDLRTPRIPTR